MKFCTMYDSAGRKDEYCVRSECGEYTIAKVYNYNESAYWYECWHKQTRLGWFKSPARARLHCLEHGDAAANERGPADYEPAVSTK